MLVGCSAKPPSPSIGSFAHASAPRVFELPGPKPNATKKAISLKDAGLDGDAIDRSVDVCQSLYSFACGRWVKSPHARPGVARKKLDPIVDEVDERLHQYLEAIAPSSTDPAQASLRDYYRSCMNVEQIDALGAAPLTKVLAKLAAAKTREDLAAFVGDFHPNFDAVFKFGVDTSRSDRVYAYINPGGIDGLTREEHVGTGPAALAVSERYLEHAKRLLVLAKFSNEEATAVATDALKIEIALASAVTTDPEKSESVLLEASEVERRFPGFPWKVFFAHVGTIDGAQLYAQDAASTAKVAHAYQAASVVELRHYLTWRVVTAFARLLGGEFRAELARWREVYGDPVDDRPRWKFCVEGAKNDLGNLLTQATYDRSASKEQRDRATALFDASTKAASDRFGEIFWLDDASRASARVKASKMTLEIGPSLPTPPSVEIHSDTYAENVLSLHLAAVRRVFATTGSPIEGPIRWIPAFAMRPLGWPSRNAVFLSSMLVETNRFEARGSLPSLWGSTGYEVGFAVMQGFGADGINLDATGAYKRWMSPEALARLIEGAHCMDPQVADTKISESTTATDRGAVRIAFRAYRTARRDATTVTVADGFTEDQQFFLAFAQDQCETHDEKSIGKTAMHESAPASTRVDLVAANLPEVAEAFGCKPNPHICEIW